MSRHLVTVFSGFLMSLFAITAKGQVAGFSVNSARGCAPALIVNFHKTVTGDTSYIWNFRRHLNDTLSNNPNPTEPFFAAGTGIAVYTVTLTVYHGAIAFSHDTIIRVYPNPIASFSVSSTALCAGVRDTFTSTSTAASGGPAPLTYLWSLGGFPGPTGHTVIYPFPTPGYKDVSLRASDSVGCYGEVTMPADVHVYPLPTAAFSDSLISCSSLGVQFTNGSTGASSYLWKFGDFTTSTDSNVYHSYSTTGTFNIKLITTTANSCMDSVTHSLSLAGNPVAGITCSTTVCINTPLSFSNTSSTHTSSQWSFGDGSPVSSAENPVHIYTSVGAYSVTLTVWRGGCFDDTTLTVSVLPVPTGSFTLSPSAPCVAPVLTTSFSATVPPACTTSWDFGDGHSDTGVNVVHNYSGIGVNTVHLYITNSSGCSNTITHDFPIYNLLLSASSTSASACATTINFSAHDSTNIQAPTVYPYGPLTYTWSFGDGAVGTGSAVAHTYTIPGNYVATVTTTTGNGCADTTTKVIHIGYPPVVSFSATPTHVCYGDSVLFTAAILSGVVDTFKWTFGDGGIAQVPNNNIKHVFAQPGIFTVTLVATYNGCASTPFIRTAYIIVDSPQAIISKTVACNPVTQMLFSDASVGDSVRTWYFGDGTSSPLKYPPAHNYPSLGTYTVTLATYNTTSGCRDTARSIFTLYHLVPGFTASDTNVCSSAPAIFNSSVSGGSPAQYYWYMADTLSSCGGPVCSYSFPTGGLKSVMLVVADNNGCTDTATRNNYLKVASPQAVFSVSPAASGCTPLPVTFNDLSTDYSGAYITNYSWSFGDGVTSTGTASLSHTYTAAATSAGFVNYSLQETVTDNIGCTSTATRTITVYKPLASFTAPTNVCDNFNVPFTNSSSGSGTLSYAWSFGDLSVSALFSPSHTYTLSGTPPNNNSIRLIVTDSHGCMDTAQQNVSVYQTVVSSFHVTRHFTACWPFTNTFTNVSTGASSFYWTLGNGDTSTAVSPLDTYGPGTFLISLIASNQGCADTSNDSITVFGDPGAFSYTPDSGCSPLTVNFTVRLPGGISKMEWVFGDSYSTLIDPLVPTPSMVYTISHTYHGNADGYLPLIQVWDSSGCGSSVSVGLDTIRVDTVIPLFTIIPDPVCQNSSTVFSDMSYSYLSNPVTSWLWSFSSSNVSTLANTFTAPGTDTVSLTVTDSWGCNSLVTQVVTVNPLPAPITGIFAICQSLSTTLTNSTPGGSWSSSNTAIAAINASTGLVTGIANGSAVITYTLPTGCISTAVFSVVFTNSVTGPLSVCAGYAITLSDSTTGGNWSINPSGIASITAVGDSSSIVVGLTQGTAIITYSLGTGCNITRVLTVNPLPAAISGVFAQCQGSSTILSDSTPGGTWSSGNTAIATVNDSTGLITGIANGTALITYTIPTGCFSTAGFSTVYTHPITGLSRVCVGYDITLTDSTTGGTWSINPAGIATVVPATSTTSLVAGITPGTAVITYTLGTGCDITKQITVNPLPGAIGGLSVCVGYATTLTDSAPGGTWTDVPAPGVAILSASGIVTGLAAGTILITYRLPTGCYVTAVASVNPLPSAIGGPNAVCINSAITLTNTITGGAWTSSNDSNAFVNPVTGLVTGELAGTDMITYTISNGCYRTRMVTVNPLPQPISGPGFLCSGSSITLSSLTPSGVWSSGSPSVATVGGGTGIVSGVSGGVVAISYTIPATSCSVSQVITVYQSPAPISGSQYVCFGETSLLGNTLTGGTWSSTNPAIAPIDTFTGLVSGLVLGTTTITYLMPPVDGGCYATKLITVSQLPGIYTVSGGGSYCSLDSGVHIYLNGSALGAGYLLHYDSSVTGYRAGTGAILDFGLLTVAGSYTVQAVDAVTGCSNDMAGSVTVSINAAQVPAVFITASPSDTVCPGTTVTFAPTALNEGVPSYMWSVNGVNVSTGGGYTFIPANGDVVRVDMTSSLHCVMPSTAVATYTMTVLPVGAPNVSLTLDPADTVCQDFSVTCSAVPVYGGYSPVYTWYVNSSPVATGAVNPYIYVPANGDMVTVKMHSDYQCRAYDSVWASPVSIIVRDVIIPHVSVIPHPSLTIHMGDTATLTTLVTNAGPNPQYQWEINGTPVTGATSSTYTSVFHNGDSVDCVVTSSGVCAGITTFDWVFITVVPASVELVAAGNNGISLTPNPNKGSFMLKGLLGTVDNEPVEVEISDVIGRQVYKGQLPVINGRLNAEIQLHGLSSGAYMLELNKAGERKVIKFVIEE